jgi:hypothetical protein
MTIDEAVRVWYQPPGPKPLTVDQCIEILQGISARGHGSAPVYLYGGDLEPVDLITFDEWDEAVYVNGEEE